jgi:adenosylcobinamide-phosphate synthase
VHRPTALAAGLAIGVALDALVPDPRRRHPVAAFGTAAAALERRMYADSRLRGAAYAATCVGTVVVGSRVLEWRSGGVRVATVAVGTWAVLGGRSLRLETKALHGMLAQGDLDGARQRITHLVSRDPTALDADGIARAAVESVAENTCDAVVAPLFWGAVAGLPGLVGYRAVNTLDAMIGYRTPRYANFGWAAARADDIANVVPARLTAVLTALAARATGGDARAALRIARRDGRRHPSPNAGVSEAAFAGALGLRLGGRNSYAGRVDERPHLGDGPAPVVADLPRAARLCAAVTVAATGVAAAVAARRR